MRELLDSGILTHTLSNEKDNILRNTLLGRFRDSPVGNSLHPSVVRELGQIFTQLATMVAEQRETVQRIDADTLDIAANVGGAQRELLKYYASISSNRWLMLQIFGVLIVMVSRCWTGVAMVLNFCSSWYSF